MLFLLGWGLGLSRPMLASRFPDLDSFLPSFLKDTIHPLEESVMNKQPQQLQ